jgi:uncharacterized phage protein gp47/JayE
MSSSGGYILYPIERVPEDLWQEAFALIKSKAPNWTENDNNLDTWILQAVASQAADLSTLARDVPESIFQYYGAKIMGLPPLAATPATVDSTWTMKDNVGYTILAGTQVSIRDSAGVEHAFISHVDIIIPSGSTATPAGGVTLASVEAGKALTGLGGVGYAATLIDTLNFVSSVLLTGLTTGGQDAELVSEYSERLSRKMQRLSQRPVLASDFSLAALDVPGIYRTLALDGYNSTAQTYNNERYLGIAGVDSLGQPINAATKTLLQSTLDAQREVNFVVNVFDPTVTQIDVTYNVKCLVGYTSATVALNATAALQDFLSPANWGKDPSYSDATSQAQTWVVMNQVIYNKIIDILAGAVGVDYVITMTCAIHLAALGTANITLPGAAPLTSPGTINGTATP